MIATTTALLILINGVRNQPLKLDESLVAMAQERCQTMKSFSHDDFMSVYSKKINSKYKYAGENLATGFASTQEMFDALENSKTHHDNNHSKNYQKIGIASCEKSPGISVTVLLFAGYRLKYKN